MVAETIASIDGSGATSGSSSVEGSSPGTPLGNQYLFNTNYILLVMKYTNIAMEHQQNLVALQGQLQGVETKIQGCLATISEFFSTMESNAASGGAYGMKTSNINQWITDPDANSGLAEDFYHMNEQGKNFGGDNGTYVNAQGQTVSCVSQSYQQSMSGFMAAINELFNSSSSGSGPTVSQLTTFANPYSDQAGQPKNFNMTDLYNQLAGGPYSGFPGMTPVSTNSNAHASLLQQYMYYQAQITVNTDPESQVVAAEGHIPSLVNFDPTSTTCDPNIMSLMQILDGLNTNVTVSRQANNGSNGGFDQNYCINNTTGNLLGMMEHGDMYNTPTGNPTSSVAPQEDPGLYCAFSYLAFNYLWNKNPSMSVATAEGSNNPIAPNSNWSWQSSTSGSNNILGSTNNGDELSDLYMNTNSSQTNLSSSGSQANSTFQEQVNGVQQMDNVSQNMISGWASAMTSVVGNWKSQ